MSKAGKLYTIITTVLSRPKTLLHVIDEETDFKKHVRKKFPEFANGLPVIDLLDLFPGFNEIVEPYSFLDGTSLPLDLAVLRSLAKKFDNCRYLEIGTWRGESVANVAGVAGECVTINLPDEEMRQRGLGADYIGLHRFFSKNLKNVKHIQHDSHTFDYSSLGKFDLVFVDGDHHYESVKRDTENILKLLKDERSVVVWHDYAFNPEKIRYAVLAGILDGAGAYRNNIYHVSNTLCAVLMKNSPQASLLVPNQRPAKVFSLKINATKL